MLKKFLINIICIGIVYNIFAQTKNVKTKEEKVVAEKSLQKEFTLEELKKYNGKNGMPVYVAVDGIVYDVTNVEAWKTGNHKGLHSAGEDLTEAYKRAPKKIHADRKILEKLPKVGIVVKDKTKEDVDTYSGATKSAKKVSPTEYQVIPSEYGKVVTCPVMKVEFKVKKNTKAFKYKDKVYYLCCSSCEKKFRENPEKYISE